MVFASWRSVRYGCFQPLRLQSIVGDFDAALRGTQSASLHCGFARTVPTKLKVAANTGANAQDEKSTTTPDDKHNLHIPATAEVLLRDCILKLGSRLSAPSQLLKTDLDGARLYKNRLAVFG